MDLNIIIANILDRNAEKILNKISSFAKDEIEKFKVDFNVAFKTYIQKSYAKYSVVKTLLYRNEPKYLYDFYECNKVRYKSEVFVVDDVNLILNLGHFTIIRGLGGVGKSTLMKIGRAHV